MYFEWPEYQKRRNVNTDKKYYNNIRNLSFKFFLKVSNFHKSWQKLQSSFFTQHLRYKISILTNILCTCFFFCLLMIVIFISSMLIIVGKLTCRIYLEKKMSQFRH